MTTNMTELQALAADFDATTKKMFKSCTFAAMSISGTRQDWEVWGDFKNRQQALDAGRMWAIAFKNPIRASVVGKKYRIVVSM